MMSPFASAHSWSLEYRSSEGINMAQTYKIWRA